MSKHLQTSGQIKKVPKKIMTLKRAPLLLFPILSAALFISIIGYLRQPVHAIGTFVVNSTADPGDGTCNGAECTLREAINDANANPDASIINFGLPDNAIITLSGTQLPTITEQLLIDGGTAVSLTISGNNASRVFGVSNGADVTINQLDITEGFNSNGGGIHILSATLTINNSHIFSNTADFGGAIRADGSILTINSSELYANGAITAGGGIFNFLSSATINDSFFYHNDSFDGGAIANVADSEMTLLNSDVYSNVAIHYGGGIFTGYAFTEIEGSIIEENLSQDVGGGLATAYHAGLLITDTLIINNRAALEGGGIYNEDSYIRGIDITIEYNDAYQGGGINNYYGLVELEDSTIIDNHAFFGGGISNMDLLFVSNSTFEGNHAEAVGGGIANIGYLFMPPPPPPPPPPRPADSETQRIHELSPAWIMPNPERSMAQGASHNQRVMNTTTLSSNAQTFVSTYLEGSNSRIGCRGAGCSVPISAFIIDSSFTFNSTGYDGGAMFNDSASFVTIINTDFIANDAIMNDGGAIDNLGELTIYESSFEDNFAEDDGAGITNDYILMVDSSSFINNNANDSGAGIYNDDTAVLTVTNSLFSGGTAGDDGGGIKNNSLLSINTTSFINNTSSDGGGAIYNDETAVLTVTNSLFAGGISGDDAGGIRVFSSTATISNSTFTNNFAINTGAAIALNNANATVANVTIQGGDATTGGGIYINPTSNLSLTNSIVAGSLFGGDCVSDGTLAVNDSNLIEDGSCSPALSGDPMLEPLANNGGETMTHAIVPGSPAIDAGNNASCTVTDQRGYQRPYDGDTNGTPTCDIGAFEYQLFTSYLPIIFQPLSDLVIDSLIVTHSSVQVTIRNQGPGPVNEDFWVDVYINPTTAPTGVNQTWKTQGGEGIVWGIKDITLASGDTLVLTIGDSYYNATKSNFSGDIATGTAVYAQVDSADVSTNYGGILEIHEDNGGAYNNIEGPVSP